MRIAGGETLRAICRDEAMPAWQTVYGWLTAHKDFSERFALARDVGAEAIAQEALEIADTPEEGVIETDKENVNGPYTEVRRADMIEHRKLRIETRLKLLAKWNPKKYGDRLNLDVEGSLDVNVHSEIEKADAARLAALLALLEARERGEDDGSDLV